MKSLSSFFRRFTALADKSALFLIVPCAVILYFIDKSMFATLLQWLVFAPVLAGVAIIVSRVTFPQVPLTKLVEQASIEGNKAAGFVAGCLIIFVGLLVLSLVMWAKA